MLSHLSKAHISMCDFVQPKSWPSNSDREKRSLSSPVHASLKLEPIIKVQTRAEAQMVECLPTMSQAPGF